MPSDLPPDLPDLLVIKCNIEYTLPEVRDKTFRFVCDSPRAPRMGEFYITYNNNPGEAETIVFLDQPEYGPRQHINEGRRWIVAPILGPVFRSIIELRLLRTLILNREDKAALRMLTKS